MWLLQNLVFSNYQRIKSPSRSHINETVKKKGRKNLIRLTDRIIHIFTERIDVWYPCFHPSVTNRLFEMNSSCFPPSTESCSCLLVASIALTLSKAQSDSAHFQAAVSMLPIVLQEDSMVSIQCLMLLGIYFACRIQPRQSYEYIRIASFRMQSLLRRYVSHLGNYEGG